MMIRTSSCRVILVHLMFSICLSKVNAEEQISKSWITLHCNMWWDNSQWRIPDHTRHGYQDWFKYKCLDWANLRIWTQYCAGVVWRCKSIAGSCTGQHWAQARSPPPPLVHHLRCWVLGHCTRGHMQPWKWPMIYGTICLGTPESVFVLISIWYLVFA